MKFDKSRIYTMVNADEVKLGSVGYFADNIYSLQQAVQHGNIDTGYFGKVVDIKDIGTGFRFVADNGTCFSLFYLVEEPGKEEFRPYKDVDEMVEDFVKRFNVNVQPYEMPLIWVKTEDADKKYLIVRFASAVTICHNTEVYTPTFEDLAEAYTYLDGSPCRIEE